MTLGIPREGVRCLSCRAGLRCLSGLSDLMKLVVGETVPALAELPGQGPLAQPLPPRRSRSADGAGFAQRLSYGSCR